MFNIYDLCIYVYNHFLNMFLHFIVSTYYEKLTWTIDKINSIQAEFRKGKQIGLYDKENVDDIA